MIDYFTKKGEAAAIKSKSKQDVADALFNNWYAKYGIPYEIHSDTVPEFTNDLAKRLNGRLGVYQRVTTPYNPQANGAVERFNKTLQNSLRIYAEKLPGTWDKYLASVTFAYNTSIHRTTGYSPFYLWHGRPPRLPTDLIDCGFEDIGNDVEQYQTLITLHLNKAFTIVKQAITDNACRKRRWRDAHQGRAHHDPRSFQEREIARIVSHRRLSKNRPIEYLVRWANESPSADEYRVKKDFFTTECIYDYWATQPRATRPREFKDAKIVSATDTLLQRPSLPRIKLRLPDAPPHDQ